MHWQAHWSWGATALLTALLTTWSVALQIDPTSEASIKNAAKLIATDMMAYYTGDQPGQTPGNLPGYGSLAGYYWWEGGGMFGTMVNYWYHTGDTTWVNSTSQAIYFQSDPIHGGYFQSPNNSLQMGNDDQAFWAFAALEAAEYKFPNPPTPYPSWLAMAQGVFNQQFQRWDPTTCNGGLHWQVFVTSPGYNYKNSISNGCFFNIAARLGKYTGNSTYVDAATRWWDWSVAEGLIFPEQNYRIIDGIDTSTCKPDVSSHLTQWTYNVGVYLYGAAAMWNITRSNPQYASQEAVWQQRTLGLLNGMEPFFLNDTAGQGVLTEAVCEPENTCKDDSKSFKAYAARWMRVTALVAPFTASQVATMLEPSIQAAATACSAPGQAGGVACGMKWYVNDFDGITGIGQDMSALEVIQTLIERPGPLTHVQGDSVSDPSAGGSPTYNGNQKPNTGIIKVTTGDKAGAWILFTLLFGTTVGGAIWALR